MTTSCFATALTVVLLCGGLTSTTRAAESEGVALAIVYDTSGSMADPVPDGSGHMSPKYVIANRALQAVAAHLQAFATHPPPGETRDVRAGLFVFNNQGARVALPFGRFDAAALQAWARDFKKPKGGTPLGTTLSTAAEAVLKSGLSRKHVLVITDGESNVGPVPAAVIPGLLRQAAEAHTTLALHFVAFDVDASVFSPVKRLGATVVSAANETQLNEQLGFILEKKILLEEEEPAKAK
jgi:hypothetical protein